jgi:MFS transporter, NRE family, putaive nickel resistance protein
LRIVRQQVYCFKVMSHLPLLFRPLHNPIFARLYGAQTINLVGDALTWLGLALLAYELAGDHAGGILSGALTVRVTAFVLLSPLAGVIADRIDRKQVMVVTHLARMVIVCVLPFVTQPWQIYGVILGLNVFSAFFTPTYTATIPLVVTEQEYSVAIALSSATYQLLGVLGPGIAGSLAALIGTRTVFWLDGLTFFIAALLILTLPRQLMVPQSEANAKNIKRTWNDIKMGSTCLLRDPVIRFALLMQLVAAITGACVLVNTVGFVQGTLQLEKLEYGWVMAAFGMGATLAALGLGSLQRKLHAIPLTSIGAGLMALALLPVHWMSLSGLLILWLGVGVGQTFVNVPTQTLIAERVALEVQGRVYGAHFAWSHFWWMFAYPLAGLLGTHCPTIVFTVTSAIAFMLLCAFCGLGFPKQKSDWQLGQWHEHEHTHDCAHVHHKDLPMERARHRHLHFHPAK